MLYKVPTPSRSCDDQVNDKWNWMNLNLNYMIYGTTIRTSSTIYSQYIYIISPFGTIKYGASA